MQTITCSLDHFAAIVAGLAREGIAFRASVEDGSGVCTITITGY